MVVKAIEGPVALCCQESARFKSEGMNEEIQATWVRARYTIDGRGRSETAGEGGVVKA